MPDEIHVAPDGNDSASGSIDRPVARLETALALAEGRRDARILLHGGTYDAVSAVVGPGHAGLTVEAADETPLALRDGSVSDDPRLLGVTARDIAFGPGSPAPRLGIRPLNMKNVGIRNA